MGACIVSPDNIIISTGYNGLPNGCSDDEYPWEREGEETKYPYVVHAELNAFKCQRPGLAGEPAVCGPLSLQDAPKPSSRQGVKEVLYLSDKYASTAATRASKRMLDSAGVTYRQLHPSTKEIVLDLAEE